MPDSRFPRSLLAFAFWSSLTMGTVFCGVMINDLVAQTSQVTPPMEQDSASSLSLPMLDQLLEEMPVRDTSLSPLEEFLRSFEEEQMRAGDASILCCRMAVDDSCNVIGTSYSESMCATAGGRIEACIDYCGVPDAETLALVNAVASSSVSSQESSAAVSSASSAESSVAFEIPFTAPETVDTLPVPEVSPPETYVPQAIPEICGNFMDDDLDGIADDTDTDCVSGTLTVTDDGQLINTQDVVPVETLLEQATQPLPQDQQVLPADTPTTYDDQHASWWEMMRQFLGL